MEINQLVRTTLELEQFECEDCGRMIYINKMDLEALRHNPNCPYNYFSETKHRRTIIVEVKQLKTPVTEALNTLNKGSVGDIRRNGG